MPPIPVNAFICDCSPTLATLLNVTSALGLRLRPKPVEIRVEAGRLPKHRNLPAESNWT